VGFLSENGAKVLMRALYTSRNPGPANDCRLIAGSRIQPKGQCYRTLTAACLMAVFCTGCATTGPVYSPVPLVGIVNVPPPHHNYLERFASLKSDKDGGGVLYWATYGH